MLKTPRAKSQDYRCPRCGALHGYYPREPKPGACAKEGCPGIVQPVQNERESK